MEAFVSCYNGRKYKLPPALKWEFSYGLGTPCDGFSITCIWDPGWERIMSDATRFWANHDGERVFTGIVDEYRYVQDETGCRLEVDGRGMQGLLLDNEALPVEYQTATMRDVVQNHVVPYGIEVIGQTEWESITKFEVAVGQSEWSVFREFVRRRSDVIPRFDRWGRLILSDWEDAKEIRIGEDTAVTKLICGEKRYGVLSQVVVQDRKTGSNRTVSDEKWIRRGGSCRRVMTVGGETDADLQKTGEYQIRLSGTERICCEVVVTRLFCAYPGDLVRVERGIFGGNGVYRVIEAATGMNENGGYTELLLRRTDLLI